MVGKKNLKLMEDKNKMTREKRDYQGVIILDRTVGKCGTPMALYEPSEENRFHSDLESKYAGKISASRWFDAPSKNINYLVGETERPAEGRE